MQRISFVFTKKGDMKYISHLDLMRLFMRALRRAELPVRISQGFNPHPKVSIRRALKLGLESDNEEASVLMSQPIPPDEFRQKLQGQLPKGIEVRDVQGNFN